METQTHHEAHSEILSQPESRMEQMVDLMEQFANLKNLVTHRVHGGKAISTERAVETMDPVKMGFC